MQSKQGLIPFAWIDVINRRQSIASLQMRGGWTTTTTTVWEGRRIFRCLRWDNIGVTPQVHLHKTQNNSTNWERICSMRKSLVYEEHRPFVWRIINHLLFLTKEFWPFEKQVELFRRHCNPETFAGSVLIPSGQVFQLSSSKSIAAKCVQLTLGQF